MRTQTLLCIDDDPDALLGYEALLRRHGYKVLISESGYAALELLKCLRIDAVILDYLMPEMDGGELASRMKQLKPHVAVMMLSSHDQLPEEALECVDVFFSKSEPPQKFVTAVQVLLAKRTPFYARWLGLSKAA